MMRSAAVLSVGVALAGSARAHDAPLVLLQQSASRAHGDTDVKEFAGFGETAPTTEKGYQLVAGLADDHEMRAFIRRLLQQEARYVKDFGQLDGIVPYYSGTQGVQDLVTLKKELRLAPWVGASEGRTAPLSEFGYQKVVKTAHKPDMVAFARRILEYEGKKAADEGALRGMLAYFDGETATQDFESLRQELLAAPWVVPSAEMSLLQKPFGEDKHISMMQSGSNSGKAQTEETWDVKSWFNKFRAKKEAEKEAEKESNTNSEMNATAVKPHVTKKYKSSHNKTGTCDDWCAEEMFVKIEDNRTVMKNLSSWAMKCSWSHCDGCSACSDPTFSRSDSLLVGEHVSPQFASSCEDWCTNDQFQIVRQNQSKTRTVNWMQKCSWPACESCSQCVEEDKHVSLIQTGSDSGKAQTEETWDVKSWFNKLRAKKEAEKESKTNSEVNATAAKHNVTKKYKPSHNKTGTCDDWCAEEMFVKIEGNKTVMKNLSSWAMKCSWSHCDGCSVCNDPSIMRSDSLLAGEHVTPQSASSCEDWCANEQFLIVRQNQSKTRTVNWMQKCSWPACESCSQCVEESESTALSLLAVAVESKQQSESISDDYSA